MPTKSVAGVVTAALIATAPLSAQANDVGAAIIGGIIGGALLNGVQRSTQPKRSYSSTQRSSNTAARAANRETQTALNYFGFEAGTADGVLGSRSRQAVSRYQVLMGYPATGRLQSDQRQHLISSYQRAQLGGPDVGRILRRDPRGVQGLLVVWRDEKLGIRPGGTRAAASLSGHGGYGYAGLPIEVSDAIDEIADSAEPSAEQLLQRAGFIVTHDVNGDGINDYLLDTSVTGSSFWCGQTECTALLFTSTGNGAQGNSYQRAQYQYRLNPQRSNRIEAAMFDCDRTRCELNDPLLMQAGQGAPALPEVVPQVAPQPTLPVFATGPSRQAAPSLASYCSKINLLTTSNGGYMTAATLRDPKVALGEQFCLGRTYSIARGEEMVAAIPGATQPQVEAQCDAFGPAVRGYVDMLAIKPAAEVLGQVQGFVLSSGMTLEQLQTAGEICLFTGYRRDNMQVALGAALVLVGTGKTPYAELVGHHLGQGYGAPASVDRARGWYDMALAALDGGATPVVMPGDAGRVELLRVALGGGQAEVKPVPASGLPSFSLE